MTDFAHARSEMIEGQIRPSGVFDLDLLSALRKTPREVFLSDDQKEFAYLDAEQKLSSSDNRQMPTPAITAKLIELAEVGAGDIVLDIACGTGYSTAILALLANSVVALETDDDLVAQANLALAELNISNAAVVQGPLTKGVSKEAPFDAILIQGAVDEIPKALFDQLRDGGRLVAVIGSGNSATAVLHVKSGDHIAQIPSFNASVPRLSDFDKKPKFTF